MSNPATLSDEQRENLVAYLDGELGDEQAAEVERLLAENPTAREQAELLTRTMSLLDELPHVSTSQDFKTRTLSAIQVVQIEEAESRSWMQRWSRPMRRGAALVVAACALASAAVLGYVSTTRWIPDKSDELISDLPVIESIDKYSEINDVAYLQLLSSSDLFNESEGLPEMMSAEDAGRDEPAARRRRVQEMSKAERERLDRKYETFQNQTDERRQALRELHGTLESDPNAARLRAVLSNYVGWLKTLSPWQRAEIRPEATPDERLAVVRRLKGEEDAERDRQLTGDRPPRPVGDGSSRRFGFWRRPLTRDDFERVMAIIEKHLSEGDRAELDALTVPERHARALLHAVRQAHGEDLARAAQRSWPADSLMKELIDSVQENDVREQLHDDDRSADHHRFVLRSLLFNSIRREAEAELDRILPQKDQVVGEYFRKLEKTERNRVMGNGANGDQLAWRYLEEVKQNPYAKDLAQLRAYFFSRNSNRPDFNSRRPRRGRDDGDDSGDRGPRDEDRAPNDDDREFRGPRDGKRPPRDGKQGAFGEPGPRRFGPPTDIAPRGPANDK